MILFLDDDLIAVNKPAGLRTIADGYDKTLPYLSKQLTAQFGRVWVVHRLDKDTSGVILFARTAEAHRQLSQQFEQRLVRKLYHAVCIGWPEWDEYGVDLKLRVNGDRNHRTVVDPSAGKNAKTECRVLERLGTTAQHAASLIQAHPLTGYTHQIRAHLAAIGLPLLGDPLYASRVSLPENDWLHTSPFQRTALHAFQITFSHPITAETLTLVAPYPDDYADPLQKLK